MNQGSPEFTRSVLRRIYLLLALSTLAVALAYVVVPPALVERDREDKEFSQQQQQLREALGEIARLALIVHLRSSRDISVALDETSNLVAELASNGFAEIEVQRDTVVTLAHRDRELGAEPLIERLNMHLDAFGRHPESDGALDGVLLVVEQLRQLTARALELREEERAFKPLEDDRVVTGILLSVLLAILWAGYANIRASRGTLRALDEAIAERDQQARRLQQERDLAQNLTDTAPVIILLLDLDGTIRHANPFFEELTGWKLDEIVGKEWFSTFLPVRDRAGIRALFLKASHDVPTRGNINPILTWQGEELEIEWNDQALRDSQGNITGLLAIGLDVTERARTQQQIAASLKQKETLLREVHHRVKNNLQIISSLLHFQSRKAAEEEERSVFRDAQDRLRSMILVHDQLYKSTDIDSIHLAGYLHSLTTQLAQSFGGKARHIALELDAEDVVAPVAVALPCGMIVVELITNVYKYAYPGETQGSLRINVAGTEAGFSLSVSDTGVGLPQGFDMAKTESFGMKLVSNLCRQLNADMRIGQGPGARFDFEIPLRDSSPNVDFNSDSTEEKQVSS